MKKTLTTIAAVLTMLLALGGYNLGTNQIASDNTLGPTPTILQNQRVESAESERPLAHQLANQKTPEEEIKSVLKWFFYYWDNNQYESLMQMFCYDVDRFQNVRNVSREKVISLIKRDKANSGIYGSVSKPRWNTLTVQNLPIEGYSIILMEDYEIDRADKSKAIKFVLENHIEMDQYYNITSFYQKTVSSR